MITDKLKLGTLNGVDCGDPGDHYFPVGFSYIETVAPGSLLPTISTNEKPRFL